jgi:putative addiction module component (TIGR02574 family)
MGDKEETMTLTLEEIRAAVLSLKPEQKYDILDSIESSLHESSPDTDAMSDEEFGRELDRRAEEARRDPSVMIPWEESMRRIRAHFQ